VPTEPLGADLGRLGQELYAPPTVYGWAGAGRWIDPVTMIRRENLAAALLDEAGPYARRLDPQAVANKHGHSAPGAQRRFLEELLLQGDLGPVAQRRTGANASAAESPGTVDPLRREAVALATLPEFHLC
jgi:hypothetical protein